MASVQYASTYLKLFEVVVPRRLLVLSTTRGGTVHAVRLTKSSNWLSSTRKHHRLLSPARRVDKIRFGWTVWWIFVSAHGEPLTAVLSKLRTCVGPTVRFQYPPSIWGRTCEVYRIGNCVSFRWGRTPPLRLLWRFVSRVVWHSMCLQWSTLPANCTARIFAQPVTVTLWTVHQHWPRISKLPA